MDAAVVFDHSLALLQALLGTLKANRELLIASA